MIDLEKVENEINKIEVTCDTSYRACERLAWLYIVRDHLAGKNKTNLRSRQLSGSEFLELSNEIDYVELMKLMDEHMQALSIVQPKTYESMMDRIRALR